MLETELKQKLALKKIWDDAYYSGKRDVSDATYDTLKDELKAAIEGDDTLKAKYWDEFTATSYSRLENSFNDVKHDFPMMSLGKSNDVKLFYKELQKWKAAGAKNFVLMWKIDGSSSAYRYRNEALSQVLTRHTGEYGKDLTVTGYQIDNLPKSIACSFSKDERYEVRGEMVIREADFELINREREAKGLDPYQNARNAAAGVSQTKDAEKIRDLHLSMIAYDVLSQDIDFATHMEKMEWLKAREFDVVDHAMFSIDLSLDAITNILADYELDRFSLGYEVDGLVAMVNELDVREELGIKSNTPEYAFAFKFKDVEIEFDIDDSEFEDGIEWCFGSTGVITPRAHFKENPRSMEILGVSIRHSTLHNVSELKRVGWKKGSTKAMVKRAGLVIPKVVEVLGSSDERYPTPPEKCPICQEAAGFKGEIYQCLNDTCIGKSTNRIMRFIESMEIDDLGQTTLDKLIENGLVNGPQDLYKLSIDQIKYLDRLGEASATKIVNNIQKSRSQPLWRVLAGLMIRGLGTTTSKACAKVWPSLEDFAANINYEALCSIDKVGDIVASNILSGLANEEIKTIINDLIKENIGKAVVEDTPIIGALTGKTFCLTGSPELNGQKVKKAMVEKMITDAGGIIASMGKDLMYLVAGPDSIAEGSNKLEKAKKQGTTIITADELSVMLGANASEERVGSLIQF